MSLVLPRDNNADGLCLLTHLNIRWLLIMDSSRILSILCLLIGVVVNGSFAQRTSRVVSPDYTGTYEYRNGTTLQLLPKDSLLLAVLFDAEYELGRYPLRPLGKDRFLNVVNDTIPFQRDASGKVFSFLERGTPFRRLSTTAQMSAQALYARRDNQGVPVYYTYQPPQPTSDGLAVASLQQVGIAVEPVQEMVQAIINEQYPNVHSVLIWKDGKLVLEEYFYGYDQQKLHQLRSASKSFVSALVGIAVDKGLFTGEQDKVLPNFTYSSYQNPDPRKQQWTIQDFLTMRTGLDCNDNDGQSAGNEENMYGKPDWVKFILDLPLVGPSGAKGSYCSGAVAVLGKTLENKSGQPLPRFAQDNLFGPLGITRVAWNYRLDNSNRTVAQLNLSPRDMLKFGLLYLNKGQWQGKQIISSTWVEKSVGKYSQLGSKQYGYLWWHQSFRYNGRVADAWLATGNGGQKLFIFPAHNLIAVFTGGNYNSPTDTPPNELVPKYVLPALSGSH